MANSRLTTDLIVRRALNGELITAYQIHTILNELFRRFGVQKDGELFQIRPQMMYNYDRNGLIVKGRKNVTQTDGGFTLEEVVAFVNKYVSNNKYAKDHKIVWGTESSYQAALDANDEDLIEA